MAGGRVESEFADQTERSHSSIRASVALAHVGAAKTSGCGLPHLITGNEPSCRSGVPASCSGCSRPHFRLLTKHQPLPGIRSAGARRHIGNRRALDVVHHLVPKPTHKTIGYGSAGHTAFLATPTQRSSELPP